MPDRFDPARFAAALYPRMVEVNPGIAGLELYEFRYGLDNLIPEPGGWASVELESMPELERRIQSRAFYEGIQIKPRAGGRIVLDGTIVRLTNQLLVGLAIGAYPADWVRAHFYFDIRGFYFLTRTAYFTEPVLAHLGSRPFLQFAQRQRQFDGLLELGYQAFKEANAEVDAAFFESVHRLVAATGTPIVVAIAGPTASGKTEIVERLRADLAASGRRVTAIEMDNFLTDRDRRERLGIHTLGRDAIHFDLFRQSLEAICRGESITMPRYDFIDGTSSHALDGTLKPGRVPFELDPAEIIFIEGNFPFLLDEVVPLIGVKAVYLTADDVRMKRKWRRDIDLRKKYEPTYFRNRYFRNQFLMAETCYRPQMERCDLVVDTTGAALWAAPAAAEVLRAGERQELASQCLSC